MQDNQCHKYQLLPTLMGKASSHAEIASSPTLSLFLHSGYSFLALWLAR